MGGACRHELHEPAKHVARSLSVGPIVVVMLHFCRQFGSNVPTFRHRSMHAHDGAHEGSLSHAVSWPQHAPAMHASHELPMGAAQVTGAPQIPASQ